MEQELDRLVSIINAERPYKDFLHFLSTGWKMTSDGMKLTFTVTSENEEIFLQIVDQVIPNKNYILQKKRQVIHQPLQCN